MGGAFLQTSNANTLLQLSVNMEMSSVDRDVLSSFLSKSAGGAPASGQIVGILKQTQDTMAKDLAAATAAEEAAMKDFDGLEAAKNKITKFKTQEFEDGQGHHWAHR